MTKKICLGLVGLSLLYFSPAPAQAEALLGPSYVYLKGSQLFVTKRQADGSLAETKPYIIKGITWSPETKAPDYGPNPANPEENVEYGFFFDWSARVPKGHEVFVYWKDRQFIKHYLTDIPLMKKMNVNTVRVYSSFGDDPEDYIKILDEFFRNDIMVIMTVAMSKKEIEADRHIKVVKICKDHPAILFWSIGNEWNLEYNKYWSYGTVAKAAKVTNSVAKAIKAIDIHHPVSSPLGDHFIDKEFTNSIEYILYVCSSVDIWGLNIYRGKNFGGLFSQWQNLTKKPFYISEFGTDSFHTTSFSIANGFQADNCKGQKDEGKQAEFTLNLWRQLEDQLSAKNPQKQGLGGLVHEFNDSLWKVGSYHVGLGGLIDYDSEERCSYYLYDPDGFYLPGAHPDSVANSEYFGIVDAKRKPKKIFYSLQAYYRKLK